VGEVAARGGDGDVLKLRLKIQQESCWVLEGGACVEYPSRHLDLGRAGYRSLEAAAYSAGRVLAMHRGPWFADESVADIRYENASPALVPDVAVAVAVERLKMGH